MITAAPPPVEVALPAVTFADGQVSESHAEQLLDLMRKRLPNTQIFDAWPSKVPGLIALKLENGRVAYTDKSARFLIMGVVFDLETGQGLDGQMDTFNNP